MYLRLQYFAVTCALLLSLSMACERRAYAYADPGSSLLLFQSLSAMFSGGLFYFRKRLKSLIFRSKVEKSPSVGNPE
jgi:hypothetical protein